MMLSSAMEHSSARTGPILLLLYLLPLCYSRTTPPPLPILPLPSAAQLAWQQGEMALFIHFGINTFTGSEWGSGRADPSLFNPSNLDARQWARAAADAGFARVVLTTKHHDGFCLWPSAYTNYSVASSPWKGGTGDVVREMADAAREAGIEMGVYLSPWDRHDESYGKTLEYNEHYLGQMGELLTRYGDIKEVFLDGAPGKDETTTKYLFRSWFQFIHQHQPNAVIFSDGGPDSRWVGDEAGIAGSTCWSLFNGSVSIIGNTTYEYSVGGDPEGEEWVPAECDVSIRPGWFWHESEHPKSALELLDIYYKSVGRNCLLILNVPPNSSGLISEEDLQVLRDFSKLRKDIFSENMAQDAVVSASSTRGGDAGVLFQPQNILHEGIYEYWAPEADQSIWEIYLDLEKPAFFNVIQIQEPIQMGQRISQFHIEVLLKREWHLLVNGTTVGYKRLLYFPKVKAQNLKLSIDRSRADPLISYFGVHLDRYSVGHSPLAGVRPLNHSRLYIRQMAAKYTEKDFI